MFRLLLLAFGGALGTAARYGLNGLISTHQTKVLPWPATFPVGTIVVNVTGCFAIGFLAAISDASFGRVWIKPEWRDFLMIGFCGGYTTFSSYGIQTLALANDGEWFYASANVLASNTLGLLAVYLGRACGLLVQSKFHGGTI